MGGEWAFLGKRRMEEKEGVDFPGQKSCRSWRKDEGTWKALRGAGAVVGINMHIKAENLKVSYP